MAKDSGSLVVPEINSGLSTQIIIKVGNTIVGAIQTLVIRQDRDMQFVEEIGNDGIIEIHPKGSTKVTIDVTRVVFDNLRLTESFARGFINIQSQRLPFDIHIIDRSTVKGDATSKLGKFTQNAQRKFSKFTEGLGSLGVGITATEPYTGHIVHVLNNCWFKSYSPTYRADNYLVTEQAALVCEFVTSMTDGKNVPTGGKRGIQYDNDTIERNTDLTGTRGKFYAFSSEGGFLNKLKDTLL
jgi:hypothetical protein